MIQPYQKSDSLTYTLGAFPTWEALHHQRAAVQKIWIHSEFTDKSPLIEFATSHHIPFEINDRQITKLSSKENVYVIGLIQKYEVPITSHNHVVLVHPSNMGNLGTIMRTMVGFGYTDLAIIKPAVDAWDPKVIRASMGAIFQLRISFFDHYESYRQAFPHHHKYPLMLQATQTLGNLSTVTNPHSLIFGNEASGLDDSFLNEGTPLIIHHEKTIDSLNLPIAVGITLFKFYELTQ